MRKEGQRSSSGSAWFRSERPSWSQDLVGRSELFLFSLRTALLNDPTSSRITDDEMKKLMLSACWQLAELLEFKSHDSQEHERQLKGLELALLPCLGAVKLPVKRSLRANRQRFRLRSL